jgi:hypothetical protein
MGVVRERRERGPEISPGVDEQASQGDSPVAVFDTPGCTPRPLSSGSDELLIDTAARRRPPGLPVGVSSRRHRPVRGGLASWRYGIAESAETNAGAFGVPHPVVAS